MIQCSGKHPIRRKTNKNKTNMTVAATPPLILLAFKLFQSLFRQSLTEGRRIYYSVFVQHPVQWSPAIVFMQYDNLLLN